MSGIKISNIATLQNLKMREVIIPIRLDFSIIEQLPNIQGTFLDAMWCPITNRFIVMYNINSYRLAIYTSTDGITFTEIPSIQGLTTTKGDFIDWCPANGKYLITALSNRYMYTSTDLINWSLELAPRSVMFKGIWVEELSIYIIPSISGLCICREGVWSEVYTGSVSFDKLVRVPEQEIFVAVSGTQIYSSTTGDVWVKIGNIPSPIKNLIWSPELGKLIGGSTTTDALYSSTDGIEWVTTSAQTLGNKSIYWNEDNSMFIIYGSDNTGTDRFSYSSDGGDTFTESSVTSNSNIRLVVWSKQLNTMLLFGYYGYVGTLRTQL